MKNLQQVDPEILDALIRETERQEYGLEMIPSENYVSEAILEAVGSLATNKYAEGLPGRRYYGGCEIVDVIEDLARARAKRLFNVESANVQPHSGATANQVAFEAVLTPGDTVLGMRLDQGGHLTHGSPVNFSGKHYNVVAYGVRESDQLIDPDSVRELALKHKPKMIIAGASAYSRAIDFAMFAKVAAEVEAVLLADIAHYAGLIVGGAYPSPAGHADIITTTTHKTLRGPRSGLIMAKKDFSKSINKAVFPGLQGGPHMHTIAAKAVCFKEAMQPEFKSYAQAVIDNARVLSDALIAEGFQVVSGGTDSHLLLVDLRSAEISGQVAEETLDQVGITANKNSIPFDPQPPLKPSGIRLGTPAITTRGMGVDQMKIVAQLIKGALQSIGDKTKLNSIKDDVTSLCKQFPMYQHRLVKS